MSNGEQAGQTQVELFNTIGEFSNDLDVGIFQLERKLIAAERRLTEKYKGQTSTVYQSELVDTQNAFEGEWYFDGEVAVVSGRVFIADGVVVSEDEEEQEHFSTRHEDGSVAFVREPSEIVPKSWGEVTISEDEEYSYYVENVRLRSHGIEFIPKFNDEGVTTEIRAAYVFSDANDENQRKRFTVYTGDLWKHRYDMPTDEEAEDRLKKQWPEQAALIEKFTKPDAKTPLARRLVMLADRLQGSLEDTDFRMMAERVINHRLQLNDILPYAVTVKSGISFYTGDNPFEVTNANEWEYTKMVGPLAFELSNPRIHFADHTDGVYRPHIFGVTYNGESSDPEFVSLAARDLMRFRATWAQHSLAERVLRGKQDMEYRVQEKINALFLEESVSDEPILSKDNDELDEEAEQIVDASRASESSEKPKKVKRHFENDGTPDWVKETEALLVELKHVMSDVKAAQAMVYTSASEAFAASLELTTEISNRLANAGLYAGVDLDVSGETIMRPRPKQKLEGVTIPEHLTLFGVDPESPFVPTQRGDSVYGRSLAVQAFIGSKTNAEGEEVSFHVYPSLIITLDTIAKRFPSLTYQGIDLVSNAIDFKGIVPLDGSAEIKIRPYELFNRMREEMGTLTQHYRRDAIVGELNALNKVLIHTDAQGYEYMKDGAANVRAIGDSLTRLNTEGKSVKPALAALNAVLFDREVRLNGEIHVSHNGTAGEQMHVNDDSVVFGRVVDVHMDETKLDNRAYVVIRHGSTIQYLPLDAITRFGF